MGASRRTSVLCRLLLLAAALTVGFQSLGFAAPASSRRGLLAGGALLGLAPAAHASEDQLVTLNVDVQGGDGPATEKVTLRLRPDWAPRGVKRFMKMISLGDLNDAAFYHVDRAAVHFGLPATPTLPMVPIKDEIPRSSNVRGTIAFKPSSYSGRVNQVFINRIDNKPLDRAGVVPIGEVMGDGMDVIDRLYDGYRKRPDEFDIKENGNKYLDAEFPKLGKIRGVNVDGDVSA